MANDRKSVSGSIACKPRTAVIARRSEAFTDPERLRFPGFKYGLQSTGLRLADDGKGRGGQALIWTKIICENSVLGYVADNQAHDLFGHPQGTKKIFANGMFFLFRQIICEDFAEMLKSRFRNALIIKHIENAF